MTNLDFIRKLYEFDHWANQETLAGIATLESGQQEALKFFGHMIAAQIAWRGRFDDLPLLGGNVWPEMTTDECRDAIERIHGQWNELLEKMTDERLAGDLVYKNLKGVEFRTPIRDVLTHVITHSVHHRGQVVAAVRNAGGTPPPIDYVAYVRKMNG